MAEQKAYKIHFICNGNTFRSRLAAAYFHKIIDDGYQVSSSGVDITRLPDIKTVQPYAGFVARQHCLTYEISTPKIQTTDEILAGADVIVFMNQDVFDKANHEFKVDSRKSIVWQVPDISMAHSRQLLDEGRTNELNEFAEKTYEQIVNLCNDLKTKLTRGSWLEVYDYDNEPADLRLPITLINEKGLWHRGIFVVVRTSSGKFVVGKRVNDIIYAPGMLEVTLGGAVDFGETPLEAARRETKEEIGINLPTKSFRPLFKERKVSYRSHYHLLTRVHSYVYSVTLPAGAEQLLKPQPGEVDSLKLASGREVNQLVRRHRLKNFGRLRWDYGFVKRAVKASEAISL